MLRLGMTAIEREGKNVNI